MCTSDGSCFEITWSRDSWWFNVHSFMSWGFPWAVRIFEHNGELSWLDISSSWVDLEARFEIPETMEVCMDCEIETRSLSLLVLGDIVCGCMINEHCRPRVSDYYSTSDNESTKQKKKSKSKTKTKTKTKGPLHDPEIFGDLVRVSNENSLHVAMG